MDDLISFLRAQYDAEDRAARATEHDDGPLTLRWRRGGKRHLSFSNGRGEDYESVVAGVGVVAWDRILVARDSVAGGPLAEHIAAWDPARVLREVEAKRAHVDELERMDRDEVGWDGVEERMLRFLALPYADRQGYRQEWRP